MNVPIKTYSRLKHVRVISSSEAEAGNLMGTFLRETLEDMVDLCLDTIQGANIIKGRITRLDYGRDRFEKFLRLVHTPIYSEAIDPTVRVIRVGGGYEITLLYYVEGAHTRGATASTGAVVDLSGICAEYITGFIDITDDALDPAVSRLPAIIEDIQARVQGSEWGDRIMDEGVREFLGAVDESIPENLYAFRLTKSYDPLKSMTNFKIEAIGIGETVDPDKWGVAGINHTGVRTPPIHSNCRSTLTGLNLPDPLQPYAFALSPTEQQEAEDDATFEYGEIQIDEDGTVWVEGL